MGEDRVKRVWGGRHGSGEDGKEGVGKMVKK